MADAFVLKRTIIMQIFSKRHAFRFQEGKGRLLVSGTLFLLLLLFNPSHSQAQRVAVRTNLVQWGVASPNLGLEFALGNRFTLECTAGASPIRLRDTWYFKHLHLQPELKYWFGTLMAGHYVGATAFFSTFDLCMGKRAAFGDAYAFGATYGYQWILSRRWNIELAAGVGAIRHRTVRYVPGTGHGEPDQSGWSIAPVKLGISFVYILK